MDYHKKKPTLYFNGVYILLYTKFVTNLKSINKLSCGLSNIYRIFTLKKIYSTIIETNCFKDTF
jgi:hypothetical protein